MVEIDLVTGVRFLGAILFVAAAIVVAFVHRGRVRSAVYERSRWLVVTASMLLGIHNILQFFGHYREESFTLCWAINLSFYVVVTPLYNMAELNLLRAGRNMGRRYCDNAIFITICYTIFAIGLYTGTIVNDTTPWQTATFGVATCTFTLQCNDCEEKAVVVDGESITTTDGTYGVFASAITKPSECTENGVLTCQAAGEYTDANGKDASYNETEESNTANTTTYAIPAHGHGHQGYTPSYAWTGTATEPACTFTLFCEDCKTNVVDEVLTTDEEAANGYYAQSAHLDETCSEDGSTTYTATGKFPAEEPSVAYTEAEPNTNTYAIAAHGHNYAASDTRHELCTTCGHTFFHYTVNPEDGPVSPKANSLLNAAGDPLTIVSNTVDAEGKGAMELSGTLGLWTLARQKFF